MVDDNTVLDCKGLSIVLDSFEELLKHDEIGSFVMTSVSFIVYFCVLKPLNDTL